MYLLFKNLNFFKYIFFAEKATNMFKNHLVPTSFYINIKFGKLTMFSSRARKTQYYRLFRNDTEGGVHWQNFSIWAPAGCFLLLTSFSMPRRTVIYNKMVWSNQLNQSMRSEIKNRLNILLCSNYTLVRYELLSFWYDAIGTRYGESWPIYTSVTEEARNDRDTIVTCKLSSK